mmetsp:Transcript_76333/g.163696  ORF Transcript_76333/g.163696 Transcript_76333/m.163696 type:complete len:843 (+) Transcript_76333:48-2576(+)
MGCGADAARRTLAVLVALLGCLGGDRHPLLAAAENSKACPALAKHSVQECGRCVSDDLCPMASNGEYMVCDPYTKWCVDKRWSAAEIRIRCPSTAGVISTWNAMCKLSCTDQTSPFGCAVNFCLNEDFPCRWVPGCSTDSNNRATTFPFGMRETSSACMRSCIEHPDMLRSTGYPVSTCAAAKVMYGCSSAQAIGDFCPTTCNTGECENRCGRDEITARSGMKCWWHIEREGMDCVDAVKQGMDCHCKCGRVYRSVSGTSWRTKANNRGAFTSSDSYNGKALGIDINATAGDFFSLSVTGESMTTEDVEAVMGPRLKVVRTGQNCATSGLPSTVTGLKCQTSDGRFITMCMTAPTTTTSYVHVWPTVKISGCGDYDVCHCNGNCDLSSSWKRAGVVRVRPNLASGISAALPECDNYMPTLAPIVNPGLNESRKEQVIRVSLSISGGLAPFARTFTALHKTMASFLENFSPLLNKKVPEPGDISVTQIARRRLGIGAPPPRRAQAGDSSEATTTTTDPGVSTTWPGGPDALRIKVDVRTFTDRSADNVVARWEQLRGDPSIFVPSLRAELAKAGLLAIDIPDQMSVYLVLGPEMDPIDPSESSEEDGLSASYRLILIILGIPVGLIVIVSLVVCAWLIYARRSSRVFAYEENETVSVSDGGYRMKRTVSEKKQAADAAAAEKAQRPPRPPFFGCFWRWIDRNCGWCCCCPRRLVRAELPSQGQRHFCADGFNSAEEAYPGLPVRLVGLSQAQFNGLTGTIVSGPNEKGRYQVDVDLYVDDHVHEQQTLSFRIENLQPLVQVKAEPVPTPGPRAAGGGAPPGSYRSQRAAAGPEGPSSYRANRG